MDLFEIIIDFIIMWIWNCRFWQECTIGELKVIDLQAMKSKMIKHDLGLGEALAMRARHLDFDRMLYHVVEGFKRKVFKKPAAAKLYQILYEKCMFLHMKAKGFQ